MRKLQSEFGNLDQLRTDLEREDDFLSFLINTIPAKFYFGKDMKEKILSTKHALMDEKGEALNKGQKRKKLSVKGKHKRARLDPLCHKTVGEIQKELVEKTKRKPKKKGLDQTSVSIKRVANIEELQKRLEERVKEFQGKIIYSKFAFSENGEGEIKDKKSEFTGKNYKKLLIKVEKKRAKIETLKSSNPELSQNLEENDKWQKAILKAENIKIKDDPTLLKKSIKKQEKIKKKKSKEWKERIEQVERRTEAHQEKRTKNIQKRKSDKLEKKIKRAKKKGRVIPGY